MMSVKIKIYTVLRRLICPFDKIVQYIPSEGELLDVGSGYGAFCSVLGKERPDLKITGIELDGKRVKIANTRFGNPNIHFIQGDMTNINFDKKFDIVTCIDVFHHIPDQRHNEVLNTLYNCLKDDGRLIIKDMDNEPFYKYIWNYIHDIIMTRSLQMYYLPEKKMAHMLENNSFMVERKGTIENMLYAHYYFSCKKEI